MAIPVLINNQNMMSKYGMVMTSRDITPPEAKTSFLEVPFRNGSIDLTEALGPVKYNDRTVKIGLAYVGSNPRSTLTAFFAEFHGKQVAVSFGDDSEFYYSGRAHCSISEEAPRYALIEMEITAEPYKLKNDITEVSQEGSGTVTLSNLSKRVVPTITTTAETQLTFSDGGYINLLPYPYYHQGTGTYTTNGVTYTVHSDGTMDINGTAGSSNANFYLVSKMAIDPTKTYKMVGCPAGGSNDTYSMIAYKLNEDGSAFVPDTRKYDFGSGVEFTDFEYIRVYFRVKAGMTVNLKGIKPMLVEVTEGIESTDYVPPFTSTTTISAGSHTVPEIEITAGGKQIKVETEGTVTFSYREGEL